MRLLFTVLVLATGVFTLDCPTYACFGQPQGCVPGSNCRMVFKFDEEGNLDLYLRDFVDVNAYAAFPLGEEANETYGYLICLPHAQKRLRATAKLGEPITVSEYKMARTVQKLGDNYFACSFPVSELPKTFQREQHFFVTTGKFVDNLVIYDGEQLYSYDSGEDSEEEEIDEETMSGENVGKIKNSKRSNKHNEIIDSSRQQEDVESTTPEIEYEDEEDSEEYSDEEIETKHRVSRRSINSVFRRRLNHFRNGEGRDEDESAGKHIEQNKINLRPPATRIARQSQEDPNNYEDEGERITKLEELFYEENSAANFNNFLHYSLAFFALEFML